MKPSNPRLRTVLAALGAGLLFHSSVLAALPAFSVGDVVRLTKSETLLFKGENFAPATKGQEFSVLKVEPTQVYVGFVKEDGTLIAVTLPVEALEAAPPDQWADLLHGMEAFRDGRYDQSKKLLARAAQQDGAFKALAAALSTRVNGIIVASASRAAFGTALQGIRDTSEGLVKLGHQSLALALEEGADRLGAQVLGAAPDSIAKPKVDRDDLSKRVSKSTRAVALCRQSFALHKLIQASKYIDDGLAAEPARPELKDFKTKADKLITDAEDYYRSANSMRRHVGGTVHALSALESGLKRCVDHPKLLELRKEMAEAFEGRTAPQLTSELLAAAGGGDAKALEVGRKLYTDRCTECHDLELLDSRSVSSWQTKVAGMARRAHLDSAQEAKIMEYIAVAHRGLEASAK